MPPTFLLPWAANLTTVSHTTEANNVPPPLVNSAQHVPTDRGAFKADANSTPGDTHTSNNAARLPSSDSLSSSRPSPLNLSSSVREMLPLLQAQGAHYITAHLYDRPYLLTQGDTVRLPFLMHGVEPGDVLRLDKASIIGSRDYTLKAPAPSPKLKSSTTTTTDVLDLTSGTLASHSRVMPSTDGLESSTGELRAPHFIPHIAKGKVSYLDNRLFVCRAVVMGVESEPMRKKEKTKRRQRKVKTVKSKHRYTILKVKEVRIRDVAEIEAGEAN